MTRALMPGRWSRDRSRAIPDAQASEIDNVVPLRPPVQVRPAITVHHIPMRRRAWRFVRALWAHLKQPTFRG